MRWFRKLTAMDLAVVALVFLAAAVVNNRIGKPQGPARFLYDPLDKNAYIRCGWYARVTGGAPYRDSISEYPQLATYLFSVPFVVADNRLDYHRAFTWMMAPCLVAMCLLLRRLCARLGLSDGRAWLVLLPGTLYFTMNRFDVVPALLTLLAVWALWKDEVPLAFALLAGGVLMKFYPALYVPLFARYVYQKHGWKRAAHGLAAFGLVLACFWAQLIWWVGWADAVGPYRYMGGRVNRESLFYFLSQALPATNSGAGRLLFRVAQLAPLLALPWLRLARPQDLLRWMTAVTITFVVFMKFQSPQWTIWITPLAVLASRSKAELALVAALDVMAYVYYPVLFDCLGTWNPWFGIFMLALFALRLIQAVLLLRPAPPTADQPATNWLIARKIP
jgi:hypothetical protein